MLLKIENRTIDYLTAFAWWTELRWELTSVWWAAKFMILTVVFWTAGASFVFVCSPSPFWKTVFGALTLLFMFCLVFVLTSEVLGFGFLERKITTDFPQGCPNPNRVAGKSIFRRRESFSTLVVMVVLALCGRSIFSEEFIFGVGAFFAPGYALRTFFFFFIACDSLPPSKKEEMRRKREEWKNGLLPV